MKIKILMQNSICRAWEVKKNKRLTEQRIAWNIPGLTDAPEQVCIKGELPNKSHTSVSDSYSSAADMTH